MSELKSEAKDLMETPMELIGWILQRHHEAMLEEIRDQVKTIAADRNELRNKYYDLIMEVAQKWPEETRHETAKRYIRERENKPSECGSQSVPDTDT